MVEVEAQRDVRDRVSGDHQRALERDHQVVVDRSRHEVGMRAAHGEMQEVIDHVEHDDHAPPTHRPRRVGKRDRLLLGVAPRPGRLALPIEREGRGHVQDDRADEQNPNDPKAHTVGQHGAAHLLQPLGVVVDLVDPLGVAAQEDLEIARHVSGEPTDHEKAGDRHDHLLADGGLVEVKDATHGPG